MNHQGLSHHVTIAAALALGLGFSAASFADKALPPIDSLVTTIIDK